MTIYRFKVGDKVNDKIYHGKTGTVYYRSEYAIPDENFNRKQRERWKVRIKPYSISELEEIYQEFEEEFDLEKIIYQKCHHCFENCTECKFRTLKNKIEDNHYFNNSNRWIMKTLRDFGNCYVNVPKLTSEMKSELEHFGFYDITIVKAKVVGTGIILFANYKR